MSLSTDWKTLQVSQPKPGIFHVKLNRPKKYNAMNGTFWKECRRCFDLLAEDPTCRVVILSANGKIFTAGLDLSDGANLSIFAVEGDTARKAFQVRKHVLELQDSFTAIENCHKPVIACIHGACIGGGIDMITACDMRYCTSDAYFSVKEVDVGLAADVGTLQRLPKVIGNSSLIRELAFTARKMKSDEALACGLVNKVCPDKESLLAHAMTIATKIASLSPIAISGTKINLNYARDHTVAEGLDYVATWNASMLQSQDIMTSVMAARSKQPATYEPLLAKL